MHNKTAFIFPGQGSQYVGMGKALWDRDEAVKDLYARASGITGADLAAVSFEGPAEELGKDVTAQLAVYVCNEAHRMAAAGMGILPDVVTGYSLGFYSALVAAGCMDFGEGLTAVRVAGETAMAVSSAMPGTMGAVIGLGLAEVEKACADASDAGGVWVSNVNAARQVLISGSAAGVSRAVEAANGMGALSAYALNMGAAYHSPMMEEASVSFASHVGKMSFQRPSVPLMSYLDAGYLDEPGDIAETVATQISRRALWKDTVQRLVADGVTRFIEAGPGSALTRMVRWVDRSVETVSMESLIDV